MSQCELINNAQDLAVKKGLPKEAVTCPAINVCEGTYCIYLSDDDEADEPVAIAKFYDRLEKHFQKAGTLYERSGNIHA